MTPEASALAVRWMPAVRRWAGDSARRFPSLRRHVDDLEGEGLLALTQAAADFDPDHGAPFAALLNSRLRGALKSSRLALRPLGYRRFRFTPPAVGPLDLALADPGQDDPPAMMIAAESVAGMAPPRRRAAIVPGRPYGAWTPLRPVPGTDRSGHQAWACRCSCGAEDTVSATALRNGRSPLRCRRCRPCGRPRKPAEARD